MSGLQAAASTPCLLRDWGESRCDFSDLDPVYASVTGTAETIEEVRRAIMRYSPSGRFLLPLAPVGNEGVSGFIGNYYDHSRIPNWDPFMQTARPASHYYYHRFHQGRHLITGEILPISYHPVKFYTSAATASIPEELRTFHFIKYVSPTSNASSNILGAYGLMHEYGAVHQNLLLMADLTDYVLKFIDRNGVEDDLFIGSPELVCGYIFNQYISGGFFYEVTFWTLEYMLFLKENHSDEFDLFMKNDAFRKVFAYFYLSGEYLINTVIPEQFQLIVDALGDYGITASFEEENNIFWLNNDYTRRHRGTGGPYITGLRMLRDEIETPRLSAILQEMLGGYEDIIKCFNCADCGFHGGRNFGNITGTAENPPTTHKYTTGDALNILRYIAGISPLTNEQRTRYGLGYNVGTSDALDILKLVAGVIA